ncbi:phage major tail protein, TP901-1 family [Rhodovulum sulfidophilum]|uniref:phage major tail protein, TP901-1 family n=1 Tax=Rhodovulum sulfidophilum TaxID=35806 RepID=UPI0009511A6F|nr:phage major tail protein, TP901-1 family [Rhodovulum sulfidophilum]NDK36955.1 phage major tail protein, TP901-1 family [Rhodovulum sulfidophilum]OLS51867.1 phage major tail protein, TP901-1 family [Rhodovulum sulfidophilum]
MAKQKGRLLLVKIGDGAETETFANLCGLTTQTLTLNNNAYEVTTPDQTDPGGQIWREVMTGIRSMAISGNGYFEDSDAEGRLRSVAFGTGQNDTADAICNFQVIVPDFGTFEGAFHVDSIEYGGEQENGVTYSISLSSSGYVSWKAVA